MHSGNVMSVSSNFVFHRVIREEINGCGRFSEYVDLKIGPLSDYEKVKETYTSVAFICGVKFYVSVYLVYTFVNMLECCSSSTAKVLWCGCKK